MRVDRERRELRAAHLKPREPGGFSYGDATAREVARRFRGAIPALDPGDLSRHASFVSRRTLQEHRMRDRGCEAERERQTCSHRARPDDCCAPDRVRDEEGPWAANLPRGAGDNSCCIH